MNNNDIKNSYDLVANHFFLTRKRALPQRLLDLKRYLHDGQQVLDLACGSGRMIRIFKDFKLDCVFVDISKRLLNYAKKEDLGKIESAQFIVQDMLESSFPEKRFDLVFCIAAFHHLKNKQDRIKFLKNAYSWLKPGGRLLMTNWNLRQKRYFKYIFNFQKRAWNDFLIPYKDNQARVITRRYYHSFTQRELKKLLLKSGFKIEKLELSAGANDLISINKKI